MAQATLSIRVWTKGARQLPDDMSELSEIIAPHVRHISEQCEQGYQSGEIVGDNFSGWWEIKHDDPAAAAEIDRLKQRDRELTLLETPPATRLERVRLALHLGRTARNHLRQAGAKSAADYLSRALKSVEGAERHAQRLEREALRKTR